MSPRARRALVRFTRIVAAGAIASAIVGVPLLLAAVPAAYVAVATPLATAVVAALDKLRRDIAVEDETETPEA